MTHLVLARKWRPQTFEDLVGQDHVARTLANAIRMDRLAHAWLFTGSRGVGKTSSARILAKALNCEKGPTATPCGTCGVCTAITAGTCVDVQEIDGASNNGVDAVRELRETLRYLPQTARYKIYIVDEVHMLSTAAFNALLKTLEEPPAHVKFIFATTEPHKIPETIMSRVQRFDFRRIPAPAMAKRLGQIAQAEGINAPPAAIAAIVRAASGGMRDALSLLDQVVAYAGESFTEQNVAEALGVVNRESLLRLAMALKRADAALAVRVATEAYEAGYDLQQLTAELLWIYRHLMLLAFAGRSVLGADVSGEAEAELSELLDGYDPNVILRQFDLLAEVCDQLGRSAEPRIAVELGLVKMCEVRPAVAIEKIMAELRALRQEGAGVALAPAPVAPARTISQPDNRAIGGGKTPSGELPRVRPSSRTPSAEIPAIAAPPPPPGPKETTEANYRAFVDFASQRAGPIGGSLQQTEWTGAGPGAIQVAVPKEAAKKLLESQETVIAKLLHEYFGTAIRLEIEVGAGRAGETLAQQRKREAKDAAGERLETARAYRGAQNVEQVFDVIPELRSQGGKSRS